MKKSLEKKLEGVVVNVAFNKVAEIVFSEATRVTSVRMMLNDIYGYSPDYKTIERKRKVIDKITEMEKRELVEKETEFYKSEVVRMREHGVKFKSLTEYRKLRDKAVEICARISTGYVMGETVDFTVKGVKFYSLDNRREYPKSVNYSANHGHASIDISLTDLRRIRSIDGVWTIITRGNHCKTLTQKGHHRNHSVFFEKGFIVNNSHGYSLRQAQVLNRLRFVAKAKASKSLKDLETKVISIDKLRKAGACDVGIKQALSDLGIKRELRDRKTTGLALTKLAEKKNILSHVQYWLSLA